MPHRGLVTWLGLCDPISALTHGVAALWYVVAFALIIRACRGDRTRQIAVTGYSLVVGAMYANSALYHALGDGGALKQVFWQLDHASIWLSIAASLGAVEALCFTGRSRARGLARLWSVAIVGSTVEAAWLHELPLFVSPLLYIGMGAVGLPTLWKVHRAGRPRHAWQLLIGGGFAASGGLLDALDAPNPFPGVLEAHELLHLLTLPAGALFWITIRQCAALEALGDVPLHDPAALAPATQHD